MPLTPLDIESKTFRRELSGYGRAEVRAYLRSCADALSQANLEKDELNRMLQATRNEFASFREREQTLLEALASSERIAGERKAQAEKEAEQIIEMARQRAQQMIERTQHEMSRIEQQIVRLKVEREQFESRLNMVIEEHRRLIETRRNEAQVADQMRARTTRPPNVNPPQKPNE